MPVDYRADSRYRHLSIDQVRKHYKVEKELRDRILNSVLENRQDTIMRAYDELFERIPWHPALSEVSGSDAKELVKSRVEMFLPLFNKDVKNILEIGCGMGELSLGLSDFGFFCVGIDVSQERISRLKLIENERRRFLLMDGSRKLDFNEQTFDVVISMQLFEHLHPDDAKVHLAEVNRVLRQGGKYYLETPNKFVGPGDVSRFFSDTPEGFHLKEYSIKKMISLFRNNGFQKVEIVRWKKKIISSKGAKILEFFWSLLPKKLRRRKTLGLHNPLYIAEK